MDPVPLTNHAKPALLALQVLALRLKQAATTAAADTVPSLLLLQAYRKDINQDLLALLLTNPVLADIAHGLLVELPAELADTDLIPQEDLLLVEAVSVHDVLPCQWIPAQV